jgi:hypothetical protein
MNETLRTTLATAFATACIVGASMAFAGGKDHENTDQGANATNNNMAGDQNSKSNKCADDANAAGAKADCTTESNAEQQ